MPTPVTPIRLAAYGDADTILAQLHDAAGDEARHILPGAGAGRLLLPGIQAGGDGDEEGVERIRQLRLSEALRVGFGVEFQFSAYLIEWGAQIFEARIWQ